MTEELRYSKGAKTPRNIPVVGNLNLAVLHTVQGGTPCFTVLPNSNLNFPTRNIPRDFQAFDFQNSDAF